MMHDTLIVFRKAKCILVVWSHLCLAWRVNPSSCFGCGNSPVLLLSDIPFCLEVSSKLNFVQSWLCLPLSLVSALFVFGSWLFYSRISWNQEVVTKEQASPLNCSQASCLLCGLPANVCLPWCLHHDVMQPAIWTLSFPSCELSKPFFFITYSASGISF
jgi:hypothetical protein